MNPFVIASTMLRRGMVDPRVPPHRVARQLASLATWGFGLAGDFRQSAALRPDAVVLVDEDRGELTNRQVLDRSDRVTTLLAKRRCGVGDRLGLLARNHATAVEVMLGASALGADLVLLNTGLSGPQLAAVAEEQGLKLVIFDDEFAGSVAELPASVERIGEGALVDELDAMPAPARVRPPERPGRTIILTSGTTGAPKGAARRNPKGLGPLISIIERIPLQAKDRILIAAPVFHTWGFAALQLSFGIGATVVLQRRFHPEAVRAALVDQAIDVVFAVPVMLQRMMTLPPDPAGRAGRRLRVVATSGSAYPSGFTTRFMDEYGDVLYNLYGSTEASWVCIATPGDLRRHPDTAGTPPLGTVVRILDDDGQPVADGEVGRIFCGNDMVFEGYVGGHHKEFVDGLVATGDIGRVDDGLYFVVGRDDDMVISGGENVYPLEVETLLHRHPAIHEVAVVGVPDDDFGQRLAAFVQLEPNAELGADEVREHVRENLARHCIPREVVFLAELPRNATGKILKKDLKDLV